MNKTITLKRTTALQTPVYKGSAIQTITLPAGSPVTYSRQETALAVFHTVATTVAGTRFEAVQIIQKN